MSRNKSAAALPRVFKDIKDPKDLSGGGIKSLRIAAAKTTNLVFPQFSFKMLFLLLPSLYSVPRHYGEGIRVRSEKGRG